MRIAAAAALICACSLEGGPHWSHDERPKVSVTNGYTTLEGSTDIEGVTRAINICYEEILLNTDLKPITPRRVVVEPMWLKLTNGESAGANSQEDEGVLVLDDDWASNALCHEMVHLAEKERNINHVGWTVKGYYKAIQHYVERVSQ